MKTQKTVLLYTILTFISAFVSCDKDDDNNEPSGVISINIMNEDNGKTTLGNSDVYIDKANNFYGPYCLISSLGQKNRLTNFIPILDGVAPKVAVETNNAYQFFKNAALKEFASGKLALNITADYYNVYVVSQIKKNDAVVGANIKFALADVPHFDLPEYNSNIGIIYHNNEYENELTITLPSSDFEFEEVFASSNYYILECEKKNNKLIVKLVDYKTSDVFGFYIRIKESYTYIYGKVI